MSAEIDDNNKALFHNVTMELKTTEEVNLDFSYRRFTEKENIVILVHHLIYQNFQKMAVISFGSEGVNAKTGAGFS